MKTKKFYAVCVYDSTCNDEIHQQGIYGRGDYYNEDGNPYYLERMIEANKWTSDCSTQWGICHNDAEKVIVNDKGEAEVVSI